MVERGRGRVNETRANRDIPFRANVVADRRSLGEQ
jgi:hypothetical protein